MSSGGWEVVGKTKKDKGGKSTKLTKAEKKKFIENAPKVEDFCEYIIIYMKKLFQLLQYGCKTVDNYS